MDSNEKKSKRPRIGQPHPFGGDAGYHDEHAGGEFSNDKSGTTERDYSNNDNQTGYRDRGGYNQYGQRQYGGNRYQQGGNPRYNNNYRNSNNGGGYRQRQYDRPSSLDGESVDQTMQSDHTEGQSEHSYNGYRSNGGGYRNNGGYGNNRQGGYNNNRQSGGYGNNRQGGYNNNRQSGGYGNNRQGGYNNNRQSGGYSNNRQDGGYGNNRQGGYNNNNRQNGGYSNNRGRMQHNEFGMPRGGKSFVPRPKRVEYEQTIPDPNEQIRLNKFMANAGICSRREADEYIQNGLVKVNGEVVTELGTKITHSDTVEYNGKVVTLESKCYILLNKPKDCVTTADDPNGRLTVMDLVKNACEERIYPVGRLDRNTTGVLLLTNDGELASKLTHPKYVKKKIYHVWTDKDISEDDMQRIADGIELEDGPIHADAISYATDTDRNQAGIEIHSGRNRIVRRIFENLGYHVTKLDRVYFAGLTKKNLPRGRWRYLTQEEVNFLKMGSFE